jgi:hypothetical protein
MVQGARLVDLQDEDIPTEIRARPVTGGNSGVLSSTPVRPDTVVFSLVVPKREEPDWISETWQAVRNEIQLYFATAVAFAFRPRATAAAWSRREFRALNPMAYLLNSLAVIGPWRALCQYVMHIPDFPLWLDVLQTTSPFLAVFISGGLHHLAFRLLGSNRRYSSSVAISIYTTGGFPTLFTLLLMPFSLWSAHLGLSRSHTAHFDKGYWMGTAASFAVLIVIQSVQACALSGAHGTTRRRAFLALILSWLPFVMLFVLWIMAFIGYAILKQKHVI